MEHSKRNHTQAEASLNIAVQLSLIKPQQPWTPQSSLEDVNNESCGSRKLRCKFKKHCHVSEISTPTKIEHFICSSSSDDNEENLAIEEIDYKSLFPHSTPNCSLQPIPSDSDNSLFDEGPSLPSLNSTPKDEEYEKSP